MKRKWVLFWVVVALGLSLPASASEECAEVVGRLAARDWQRQFLLPAKDAIPLEARFRGKPLFYHLGSHLGSGLNSVSFSNELPSSLISDGIREDYDRRKSLFNPAPGVNSKFKDLAPLLKIFREAEPVHARLSLTNVALCCRNLLLFPLEVINMYTTAMDTGPWVPRMRQFHKIPNFRFFNDYLSPDINSQTLSPLGLQYAAQIPGKTFLDLASGDRNRAVAHRAVAQRFGAKDYVGVDTDISSLKRTWRGEFPQLYEDAQFTSRYFKTDILSFLRRLKSPGPLFVRIEGLEAYGEEAPALEYLQLVMKELQRVTQPGDILSVGNLVSFIRPPATDPAADSGYTIDPTNYGFHLLLGEPPPGTSHKSGRERLWVKD